MSHKQHKVRRKLKSGVLEKADTGVGRQVKFPHTNLSRSFVHKALTFERLNFECFLADELKTIEKADDADEILGRIRLLIRICYWKAAGNSWVKIRSIYQAVMRSIEDREAGWLQLLYPFDALMHIDYDRIVNSSTGSAGGISGGKSKGREDIWFCKEFNKGECSENSPHSTTFKGEDRLAVHICSRCWKDKKVKRYHPAAADDCPSKQ